MAPRRPRRSPAERVAAWILTGPLGRLAGMVAELAHYWRARARERRGG